MPMMDPRQIAEETMAAALIEARSAAALDRLYAAAEAADDHRAALAVLREQRLHRADRLRTAAAIARTMPAEPPAIETHAPR